MSKHSIVLHEEQDARELATADAHLADWRDMTRGRIQAGSPIVVLSTDVISGNNVNRTVLTPLTPQQARDFANLILAAANNAETLTKEKGK